MLATGLRAVQLALTGLGIYLVSTAVSTLVGASPSPRAELPEVAARPPATADANRYAVISERNLFKTRDRPAAPQPAEEQLQETGLGVRLLGTTVSKIPELSVASVEDVARRENLALRISDTVAGATLVRIERGRIVIDNGGVLEWLSLADDQGSAGSAAQASRGRRTVSAARSSAGGASRPIRGTGSRGRRSSPTRASPTSGRAGSSSAGTGGAGGAVAGAAGEPGAARSPEIVIVEADSEAPPERDHSYRPETTQAPLHGVESALQTWVGTNGLDLQPGETIVAMDGQNVTSPAGIESAVRDFVASGNTTLTIVATDGSTRSQPLSLHMGGPRQ